MIRASSRRLVEAWQRFWFAPAPAIDLGVSRALFFSGLLLFALFMPAHRLGAIDPRDLWALPELDPVFWSPSFLFRLLHLPLASRPVIMVLWSIWIASLASSALGLWTRGSTALAFVLGTYLVGLPQNQGKANHGHALLPFVLATFALSRAGASCSLDRLRARRRGHPDPAPSGEHRWPLRCIQALTALVFLAAAVSKLRHAGLSWVMSDNFAYQLATVHCDPAIYHPIGDLGLRLARQPLVCRVLAGVTLAIEALLPVALFSRPARPWLVAAAVTLLLGFGLVLGIFFVTLLLAYLAWIPWARWLAPRAA